MAWLIKFTLLYRRRKLGYQRMIIDVPYHLDAGQRKRRRKQIEASVAEDLPSGEEHQQYDN